MKALSLGKLSHLKGDVELEPRTIHSFFPYLLDLTQINITNSQFVKSTNFSLFEPPGMWPFAPKTLYLPWMRFTIQFLSISFCDCSCKWVLIAIARHHHHCIGPWKGARSGHRNFMIYTVYMKLQAVDTSSHNWYCKESGDTSRCAWKVCAVTLYVPSLQLQLETSPYTFLASTDRPNRPQRAEPTESLTGWKILQVRSIFGYAVLQQY